MRSLYAMASLLAIGVGCTLADGPRAQTGSVELSGAVDLAVIRLDAGSLIVRGTSDGTIAVEHEIQWSDGANPTVSEDLVDGVLTVEATCPEGAGTECSVDLVISLPRGAAVEAAVGSAVVQLTDLGNAVGVEIANGDVLMSRIGGDIWLDVANGDVQIERATGDLHAELAAGSLRATGLSASEVYASTSSGKVDLEVERLAGRLTATTKSGDATVAVPDNRSYDVSAFSENGEVLVDVSSRAGAQLDLYLASVDGDIVVEPLPEDEAESSR
jgi:hypothetical protein